MGLVLAQAEFTYNNSINKSTTKTPFQIVYGYHPREVDTMRNTTDVGKTSAEAEKFAEYIHQLQQEVRKNLEKSK